MTDEIVAYMGWGISAREQIDGFRKEVRELKAENARLREDNDRFIQAIEDLHDVSLEDELVRLENENAKLREVGRAAWRCIHTGASCYDCRLIAGGCTLQTAMRELGVEI